MQCCLSRCVEEEVIFLAGHAVVEQIFVHLAVDAPAVIEVERQEAPRVQDLGRADRGRAVGVEIFRGFALDEDRVGAALQDLDHRQHVGFDDVLQRGDEADGRSSAARSTSHIWPRRPRR